MISMSNPPKPSTPIEDPRALARLLVPVLEERPDLLARTGPGHTALDRLGARTQAQYPEAVRFCALGLLERLTATGVASSECAGELTDMLATRAWGGTLRGGLGTWFEGTKQDWLPEELREFVPEMTPREQYVAMLREIAAG